MEQETEAVFASEKLTILEYTVVLYDRPTVYGPILLLL